MVDRVYKIYEDIVKIILNCEDYNAITFIKHIIFNVMKRFLPGLFKSLCTYGNSGNNNIDLGIYMLKCKIKLQNLISYYWKRSRELKLVNYILFDYLNECFKNETHGHILNKYIDLFSIQGITMIGVLGECKKYNKFAKNLINPEECVYYCGENFYTDYVDTDHGHIHTGNLKIVTDLVLWAIFYMVLNTD